MSDEILQEDLQSDELDSSSVEFTDVPGTDGSDAESTETAAPSDVRSDVSDNDLSDVSGSDVEGSPDVLPGAVGYALDDAPDYSDALAHIDFILTGILFWIVFAWCAHHIRNAVRSFTGRNIKNE